jgi:hypothetical protein
MEMIGIEEGKGKDRRRGGLALCVFGLPIVNDSRVHSDCVAEDWQPHPFGFFLHSPLSACLHGL